MQKSTVDQIRARFDADVERFSDLALGQQAAMDSVECLELICRGVAMATPDAQNVLDVGCGAGNWTVKLLERLPPFHATLLDLSRPMLDRAEERVRKAGAASTTCVQADLREAIFADGAFDVIVTGAALHHLRSEAEWHAAFAAFHRWLRPGGWLWMYDLIGHESPTIGRLMRERYAAHLYAIGGSAYREKVLAYSDEEDSPRPTTFQTSALRSAGFKTVDVLHQNGPFGVIAATR